MDDPIGVERTVVTMLKGTQWGKETLAKGLASPIGKLDEE